MANPVESDDELLDAVLGRLEHLNVCGRIMELKPVGAPGSSCDVFASYLDVGLRRVKVAVKKLRVYASREPIVVKRLTKEAYIWSKLRHENVLPLVGFFLGDDNLRTPHFVSIWMEKGTLLDYMTVLEYGEKTITLAKGIAAGMTYLHKEGVIHADLKSQNILISDSGHPIVTDFGLSRILAASITVMCSTTASFTKGTVRWMAIELFMPPQDSQASYVVPAKESDVWAFGMVVYELLSHKLPYHRLSHDIQVMNAVVGGTLPDSPQFGDGSEERVLWEACQKCWMREPEKRPSMEDLFHLIRSLIPDIFDGCDKIDLTFAEQSATGLFGSQVAIVPAEGDWFATYDPFVEPVNQLNIGLIHSFKDVKYSNVSSGAQHCFSWDGEWLAVELRDGPRTIQIYGTNPLKAVQCIKPNFGMPPEFILSLNSSIREISLSTKGTYLLVHLSLPGAENFQIYRAGTGTFHRAYSGARVVFCGSQPENVAIYDGVSGELEIRDVETNWLHKTLVLASHGNPTTLIISADIQFCAMESKRGEIYIWSLLSGIRRALAALSNIRSKIFFTSDGKFLAREIQNKETYKLDLYDLRELERSPEHDASMMVRGRSREVDFPEDSSPQLSNLDAINVTAVPAPPSRDLDTVDGLMDFEKIDQIDVGEREEFLSPQFLEVPEEMKMLLDSLLNVQPSGLGPVRSLSFASEIFRRSRFQLCEDGKWLIEILENRIYFWDIHAQSPQARLMLEGHDGPVDSVVLSPQGGLLLSTDKTGMSKLWKYSTFS